MEQLLEPLAAVHSRLGRDDREDTHPRSGVSNVAAPTEHLLHEVGSMHVVCRPWHPPVMRKSGNVVTARIR